MKLFIVKDIIKKNHNNKKINTKHIQMTINIDYIFIYLSFSARLL
jgi:hypothetical protein